MHSACPKVGDGMGTGLADIHFRDAQASRRKEEHVRDVRVSAQHSYMLVKLHQCHAEGFYFVVSV